MKRRSPRIPSFGQVLRAGGIQTDGIFLSVSAVIAGIGTLIFGPEDWAVALGLLMVGGLVGVWTSISIAKNSRGERPKSIVKQSPDRADQAP